MTGGARTDDNGSAMFTIIGAQGFIGSRLARRLEARRVEYRAPGRGEDLAGHDLGHVVYCAGLTADFRTRPHDAVEAHVCGVLRIVRECRFESFVYLSSTRLYKGHGREPAREENGLLLNPSDPDDLYGLSKAAGESVVRLCGERARIARLSNVYGDDFSGQTFLSMIVGDALTRGEITLRSSPDSEKDYVSVGDVVGLLPEIALRGRERAYNVASGVNVTNAELVGEIARLTGCRVEIERAAETVRFPVIDTGRVRREFGFAPSSVLRDLPRLIDSYRRHLERER